MNRAAIPYFKDHRSMKARTMTVSFVIIHCESNPVLTPESGSQSQDPQMDGGGVSSFTTSFNLLDPWSHYHPTGVAGPCSVGPYSENRVRTARALGVSRWHSCPGASSLQPLRVRLQAGVGPHGESCLHSWILDESMESFSCLCQWFPLVYFHPLNSIFEALAECRHLRGACREPQTKQILPPPRV